MTLTTNQQGKQLSQEALQTALLQLLESTPFDEITITQLTERAGVSRMTYYRHYASLEELFYEIIHHFFQEILDQGGTYIVQGKLDLFWSKLFHFLYQHQHFLQTILSGEQRNYVLRYLNDIFDTAQTLNTDRYRIRGIIGLTYNVMIEWIQQDYDLPPDDLADLLSNLIQGDAIPQNSPLLDLYK